ncbi:MAG TPA: hypothetical protein DDZ53_13200 [Firmicutes bacterium]|nr:hypothetical protein [Bacillota bacterium]
MIKIAHVISDTAIGGAGRYLLALLPGAVRHDWELTVYAPEGDLAAAVRDSGVARVIVLPEGERSFSVRLWRWLQRNLQPADVVHTHASLAARLAAKQRGYPVVLTRHTIGPDLPPGGLKPARRCLYHFVAKTFSDATIAVSEACRQRLLLEGVPESMLRLVYHGIDTQPYLAADGTAWRKQLGLADSVPVIITVARLASVKGLQYAIAASAELKNRGLPFTWLFVGQGPELASLQAQAKELGLTNEIRWLGFQEDIPGLLAAADVFVLPSLQEALGLVVLEAMAAGLPVIASHVGGIPELINDGQQGLLVLPADSAELARAVAPLLADKEQAARLGTAGRKRVLAQFTAENMWQQTDAVYREVMDSRRCKR